MNDRAETILVLSISALVICGLALGLFYVLKPNPVTYEKWGYPVQPFTFTRDNPPENAFSKTVIVKNGEFTVTDRSYIIYVWPNLYSASLEEVSNRTQAFYWTYREIISP